MLKILRILLLAIVTITIFTSCKENNQPSTPSEFNINYMATILDNSNKPIINAVAIITTKDNSKIIASDTSDENGFISFVNIKSNSEEINLIISHPLYNTTTINYGDFGKKETDKIVLEDKTDCCGIAELTLSDEEGNPIKNVLVQVRQNMKELKRSKSDESGKVKFTGLCLEKYELRLSIDGFKVIEKNINIENCEKVADYTFTMIKTESKKDTCCKGILRFKPKDKDGNILKGTKVYIYKDGKVIEDPVVKEGQAIVDGLCEGKYTIVYKSEGYKDKEVQVELGCNQDKTLDDVLEKTNGDCCKGILRFKPKDKDGNTLNGTKVYIYKDGKVIEDPVVKEGQAAVDGLCEGKYTIVYKREGYKDKEIQVELGCNQEKTLDDVLEKANEDCCDAILKFIVMDNDTKTALKDAKITLKLNGKVIFEKKATDGEGEYLAKELCKGKYTVIIEKDGYNSIETTWNVEKCDDFQEHFWMKK